MIDHTGIPSEWIEHLSSGYPTFCQDPIATFFQERIGSGADVGPATKVDRDVASHCHG